MANPKWQHHNGDTYSVVSCQFVGNEQSGFSSQYTLLSEPLASRALAWRSGCCIMGHDDFNLAVVRDGQLVAMLWDDELVDDDAGVLADVGQQTGLPVGLDDGRLCEDCPPPLMAGGFVDSDGVTWPTCPQCGKTHPCAEMPPEQAEQIAQWERELAQYAHRSDSTGFAGRIGEEVLRALWRARLANAVLNTAYRRSIEKRLELARYIAAQEAISSAPPAHSADTEVR